jgi:hypothetical protein
MKSQAHWQTDVLACWAPGTAVGYWATRWDTPLFVQLLPRGSSVCFSKRSRNRPPRPLDSVTLYVVLVTSHLLLRCIVID